MAVTNPILRALRSVAFAAICMATPAISHAGEVTDVLGRKVNVPDHVERIVLGESRLSHVLGLLDRDNPVCTRRWLAKRSA